MWQYSFHVKGYQDRFSQNPTQREQRRSHSSRRTLDIVKWPLWGFKLSPMPDPDAGSSAKAWQMKSWLKEQNLWVHQLGVWKNIFLQGFHLITTVWASWICFDGQDSIEDDAKPSARMSIIQRSGETESIREIALLFYSLEYLVWFPQFQESLNCVTPTAWPKRSVTWNFLGTLTHFFCFTNLPVFFLLIWNTVF